MFANNPRRSHPRRSYEARTGMNTRAAIVLAKALTEKPATIEDDNGNIIRLWKPSESSSYRACCRIRARNGIRAVLALNNL